MPDDKKNAVINVFRKLKQTVLWKWEDDDFKDKPDNLIIRKWMPQKEILGEYYILIMTINVIMRNCGRQPSKIGL